MAYETVFGSSVANDILSSYGLSDEDVLQSLVEYYEYRKVVLTQAGIGGSSFTVVLASEELLNEIYQDVNLEGYVDGYMITVAENLGLSNYNMSLHLTVSELPNGYVILTQDTNLTTD